MTFRCMFCGRKMNPTTKECDNCHIQDPAAYIEDVSKITVLDKIEILANEITRDAGRLSRATTILEIELATLSRKIRILNEVSEELEEE